MLSDIATSFIISISVITKDVFFMVRKYKERKLEAWDLHL